MALQQFKNNVKSTIQGSLAFNGTTITVAAATGAAFPSPTAGDFFLATLYELNGSGVEINHEIVKCTARTSDTITIATRDFENMNGGVGRAYPDVIGNNPSQVVYIELRWTAYAAGNSLQAASNLAEINNAATARTNLGLGAAATQSVPTGIVLGNGTTFSAAAAGTDYQAPIGTISGVAKGNGANALTAATAGTDYAKPDTASTWSAAQRGAVSTLTDGATITPNFALGNNFLVQLGGNRTLGVPTNLVADQQGTITVLQDKTGSRTLAYAWPYVWAGGTAGVLSTAGCSEDQLVYEVRSYNSATVTITIATPGVVTMTGHGFFHGQRVQITTTGALPTGLTASTTYFVEVIDANSFYLCTTLANVASGTRIATSGSQSGTHTLVGCTIRLALNKAFA